VVGVVVGLDMVGSNSAEVQYRRDALYTCSKTTYKAVHKGPRCVVWVTNKAVFERAPEGVRFVQTFRGFCEVWWYLWTKHRNPRLGDGCVQG